jgi:lipopolysaccharide transport protein LptA
MAPSGGKSPWLLAVALAAAAWGTAGPETVASAATAEGPAATALVPPSQQPITVDAASSKVDYRTNTLVFDQVVIAQGDMRVEADHGRATGLNFANSHWTFDGHVRVDADPRGKLRSDEAVVDFRDNRIARATVTGKPAEFEQKIAGSQQIAHGHADQIVYDLNDGIVRLENDAWLSDGQRELTAPQLVYNIRAQTMQAASGTGGQRVHITINPNSPAPPAKSEPAKSEPPKDAPESPRPQSNPPP